MSNIGDGFGHMAAIIAATAAIASIDPSDQSPFKPIIFGFIIFIAELTTWVITTYFLETNWAMMMAAVFGYGIGLTVAGLLAFGG